MSKQQRFQLILQFFVVYFYFGCVVWGWGGSYLLKAMKDPKPRRLKVGTISSRNLPIEGRGFNRRNLRCKVFAATCTSLVPCWIRFGDPLMGRAGKKQWVVWMMENSSKGPRKFSLTHVYNAPRTERMFGILTWTFQRVPNGSKRVSTNHPLGFNWHPLEGAGKLTSFIFFFFLEPSVIGASGDGHGNAWQRKQVWCRCHCLGMQGATGSFFCFLFRHGFARFFCFSPSS